MLENLIGAQIVSIDEDSVEVKLEDKIYKLKILSYDGDCCGYTEFSTSLLYEEDSERNPIITNVEIVSDNNSYCDRSVITFYGENKALATIDSEAGSGSGWSYGACVYLVCEELNINEDLASW